MKVWMGYLFVYLFILCRRVDSHKPQEANSWRKSIFSFHHVSSEDWIPVARLGSNAFTHQSALSALDDVLLEEKKKFPLEVKPLILEPLSK